MTAGKLFGGIGLGCIIICGIGLGLVGFGIIASRDLPATHHITYTVMMDDDPGGVGEADITYEGADGASEQQTQAYLPWRKEFDVSHQFLYVSAQNRLHSGVIHVRIWVDNQQVKEATSSGEFAIASTGGYF